jgi:stage II sporulation protein M
VASLSFALLLARRFYNSKVQVWPSFVVYSSLMLVIMACAAGAGLVEVYFTPFLVKTAANYMF